MTSQPSRLLRRYGGIALLGLTVVAGLFAATRLSRHLFERPTRSMPPAVERQRGPEVHALDPAGDGHIFQVAMAEGRIDAFRHGRWIPIRKGDLLTRQDMVRTDAASRAVLRLGASMEIELRERVEIRLDTLSSAGASLHLSRGKVLARVAGPEDNLAITAQKTRTSNRGPAHFVVVASERGRVSVASTSGTAQFSAGGKEVSVTEGTESFAEPGQPAAEPDKIPEDVLLSVVWPAAEKHGEKVAVEGQVGPNSAVMVNGAPAHVTTDGRFVAAVPLREGSNVIEVEAEDLGGRRKKTSATLLRRSTRPPKLAPEPTELWKK
jgi:hypothetical protein